jgi:hypothetical protein
MLVSVVGRRFRELGKIFPRRFEHHIEVVGRAEGREKSFHFEMMRSQIVEDGPALVEQGLDVDQFQGPDTVPEDLLTEGEASRTFQVHLSGAFQVLGTGGPENPGEAGRPWERFRFRG